MRKQMAIANWKMNLTFNEGQHLVKHIIDANIKMKPHCLSIFSVPFPYLQPIFDNIKDLKNYYLAAQNCSHKKSGAYTGEVSAEMLQSIGIKYCIIGHSERREYFGESNEILAEKVNRCLENKIIPIFCCGENLTVRENEQQNLFVENQLNQSLFHLSAENFKKIIIAYEPIWAIGTGKTASTAQAQEMHAFIRNSCIKNYDLETANQISILYGGSVKADNASEIFSCLDVDGGLVGGASLVANDFVNIMMALK